MSVNIIESCHWEITTRCNLSCKHCIASGESRHALNTKLALKAVDILHDWGCGEVYLTGGEPLMRGDIFRVLKRTKDYGMKAELLSNGTLIERKNIKQIKNYVDKVGISLDGSSAKVNDQIRGKSFDKIMVAIDLLRKEKIPLALYVTICKLNIDDVRNILELAKSLEINNIRINEISLRGRAQKNRDKLALDKQSQLKLKENLVAMLREFGRKDDYLLSCNACEINNKNIFISPKGYIYPCIEIYQQEQGSHLGNILEVGKSTFKNRRDRYINQKPTTCPYQFIVNNDLVLCLNKTSKTCKLLSVDI